jgi:N-glycosylase/DNA lyase
MSLSASRWSSIPITLSNLTLANTLPVGQSFLWHRYPIPSSTDAEAGSSEPGPPPTEEFSRAIDNPPRVIRLRQTPTQLQYSVIYPNTQSEEFDKAQTATRAWIKDYFQLDHDLDALYREWSRRDPDLFGKIDISGKAVGVRLLRQDPWECLVA